MSICLYLCNKWLFCLSLCQGLWFALLNQHVRFWLSQDGSLLVINGMRTPRNGLIQFIHVVTGIIIRIYQWSYYFTRLIAGDGPTLQTSHRCEVTGFPWLDQMDFSKNHAKGEGPPRETHIFAPQNGWFLRCWTIILSFSGPFPNFQGGWTIIFRGVVWGQKLNLWFKYYAANRSCNRNSPMNRPKIQWLEETWEIWCGLRV